MPSSKKNKKGKNLGLSINEELTKELEQMVKETGMKQTDIGRRALASYFENGANEPAIMLQLINIVQTLNEVRDYIPEEKYEVLQTGINNIMILKGGDSYAEN